MIMRKSLYLAATLSIVFSGPTFAQDLKVGTISELSAWTDHQGLDPGPRLHVLGLVVVKNACFEASTLYAGETKSIPSTLLLKVEIRAKEGILCPAVEGQERNIEFRYDDPAFVGNAADVSVSSETDEKKVEIKKAH
jgi:hypothetical protein